MKVLISVITIAMNSRIGVSALALASLALPLSAFAADITNLLVLASNVLNALVGLLVTAAIVVFFWGIVRYLFQAGPEAKSDGLKTAMYGVLTIFIMVSIWGIINLLRNTFQVTDTNPVIPRGVIYTR